MKKYIIVYYSRTGVSKKAAGRIYELLGGEAFCDIEEIIDMKNRSGIFGAFTSLKDCLAENITKIEAVKNQPGRYHEVVILTPVWAGRVADAIRTYLAAYKSDIRALSLVVCGGSDSLKQGEGMQKDILRKFALKTKALVTLRKKDVLSGNFDSKLQCLIISEESGD